MYRVLLLKDLREVRRIGSRWRHHGSGRGGCGNRGCRGVRLGGVATWVSGGNRHCASGGAAVTLQHLNESVMHRVDLT